MCAPLNFVTSSKALHRTLWHSGIHASAKYRHSAVRGRLPG
jgi:hypothetical protein